jgi:hypothetical protein
MMISYFLPSFGADDLDDNFKSDEDFWKSVSRLLQPMIDVIHWFAGFEGLYASSR